jgi:Family of unknown function (DUF5677)
MGKGKTKPKNKKSGKSYSGINAHKRQKKSLVPPLMAGTNVSLQSWVNDRLPEMLWAALLISRLGRTRALRKFRQAADILPGLPLEKRNVHPTQSGLASLEPELLKLFLATICSDKRTRTALRPLLLFDNLPARAAWAIEIGIPAEAEDWNLVKTAILQALDHQSQEATDCRWLRVLFQLLSGKLHLQTREQVQWILEYPHSGIPQMVRPMVRSMEGILDKLPGQPSIGWSQAFWDQCFRDTPCEPRHTLETRWLPAISTTSQRIKQVREALARHEHASLKTTDIDARHDATFGFGAYALAILDDLVFINNSTSILGRLGLRTLLEIYVTILRLQRSGDPALWTAYRQYGSGQAKLAFLKLDDTDVDIPSSINLDVLRNLANEDRWLEFVSIDLGHWAAGNLRELSEATGVKPDYDRLYPWTSAFTHGNWAAVRNSCFDLCVNPVHRLHRRLRSDTASLGDVIPDACELVDKILAVVDDLYPGFSARVTLPESRSESLRTNAPQSSNSARALAPLATVQRELFQILDEFFRRATGCSAEEFAPLDSFGDKIRAEAHKFDLPRIAQSFLYVHEALGAFYKRFASHIFSSAKHLPGLKLVLGGGSNFGKSQFDSVRKMLLYADSILIPDPIYPWIESPRVEEAFGDVRLLEAAFVLLHLKPIVDADLPAPAIVVFPSFEKSLEERDPATQRNIDFLVSRVLSHSLGENLETLEELREFAVNKETEFLRAVDERKLFVAPGGQIGQPLDSALKKYSAAIAQWRSKSFQTAIERAPKGVLVLNGLAERISPHYHLLENAEELAACPLLALRASWHYYSLISKFFADQLQTQGYLDARMTDAASVVQGLQQPWLGNIPLTEITELLSRQENEEFRTRLKGLVSQLHNASLPELNRVNAEVRKGISALFKESRKEVQSIQEKCNARYGDMHVQAYVTSGARYMTTLAPVLRRIDKQESDAKNEPPVDMTNSAKSLLGILGVANEE